MNRPLQFAITDHVEGPREQPSAEVFQEVAELACVADRLGFDYFWFSEHHAHAHHVHLPAPLLFALHLAGRTERTRLGTAIICLNLHHPLDVAEQVAIADTLTGGRISPGFGSGSSPEEFRLFGLEVTGADERHARFAEALQTILDAWRGDVPSRERRWFCVPPHRPLPVAAPDLPARSWIAVNSVGSARIAGVLGFNMMFSHLRTPEQYRQYANEYREAGGRGLIAANRPVYVGRDDGSARHEVEPALRALWRRFREEGKIPSDRAEPESTEDLAAHPINFLIGGPETVARRIRELYVGAPFDVLNVEPRWAGLPPKAVSESLRRFAEDVRRLLD